MPPDRYPVGRRGLPLLLAGLLTLAACGQSDESAETSTDPSSDPTTAQDQPASDDQATEADPSTEAEALFPDVIEASAQLDADGTWSFDATLSSPYDTPDRYADAWRVVGPDGTVYGIRELLHDHGNEQPFTRSQSGIEIPPEVTSVTVEGRDQISGWGGETVVVELVR